MKVKDLLNNINRWFKGPEYYCNFITNVQETYNEKTINPETTKNKIVRIVNIYFTTFLLLCYKSYYK